MPTLVVNMKLNEEFDAYVGRAGRGWGGRFGNPFRGPGAIEKFRAYFHERVERDQEFRADVLALPKRAKAPGQLRIACFCASPGGITGDRPLPYICHGQVIAAWLDAQAVSSEVARPTGNRCPPRSADGQPAL